MHTATLTNAATVIDYGPPIEQELGALDAAIAALPPIRERFPTRWLAIKLLEQDPEILTRLTGLTGGAALIAQAQHSAARLHEQLCC